MDTMTTEDVTEQPPEIVETKARRPRKGDVPTEVETRVEPEVEAKPEPKAEPEKTERKGSVKAEPGAGSAVAREISQSSDRTILGIIEGCGGKGKFKCRITRTDPMEIEDTTTGKWVATGGFLAELEHEFDEDWLQKRFGGGTYELQFKKPGPKSGWVFGGQTTVRIAGEPNLAALPRAVRRPDQQATPAQPPGENPSLVRDAMNMVKEQADRERERADKAASGGGMNEAMMRMFQSQLEAKDREMTAMRDEFRQLIATINRPAAPTTESKVEDKLLGRLFDEDNARINALRTSHESEVRILKENARQDQLRLEDRHERELANLRQQHDREIANLKQAHELAIKMLETSATTVQVATKSASDVQHTVLAGEVTRLQAENAKLAAEVDKLRERKDKSPIEMLKEVKTLKEAIGLDDEDEPESKLDKIVDVVTNPEALAGLASLIRPPAPAAAPQQQVAAPPPQRRKVRKDGKIYWLEADGKTMTPYVPPQRQIDDKPAEPQMPNIDPTVIAQIVMFLESAFEAGQEPATVAQSARSRVPEELLTAIRDHGVDKVMSQMAKLSSTSPLSSQRGRVWVRDLGKALVGE